MRIWWGRPVSIRTATTDRSSRISNTDTCETAGLPWGDAACTRPSRGWGTGPIGASTTMDWLTRHSSNEGQIGLIDAPVAPFLGHRATGAWCQSKNHDPRRATAQAVQRHRLGDAPLHRFEKRILQEPAVRHRGETSRLGDRQEVRVTVKDGEGERNGRLLPRRPLPHERLAPVQPAFRLRAHRADEHLTRVDPRPPLRLVRVPVAPRQVVEDRLSFGLRADRLAVVEPRVHSSPASSNGGRESRTTRVL